MHLNWNPLGRLVAPHRFMVAAAAAAAAVVISLPASAETSVTVTAGAAEAEVGVKAYEVSTETEPVTDDTYWFCQVVGKPSIAGSVTVTTANGNTSVVIRHAVTGSEVTVTVLSDDSFFVTKYGAEVAHLIPAPFGSEMPPAAEGFASLATDPAWQIFLTAVGDANLQQAIDALGEQTQSACETQCETTNPVSQDCEQSWDNMTCCKSRCKLTYCKMTCNCTGAANPAACQAKALIWRTLTMARCVVPFFYPNH